MANVIMILGKTGTGKSTGIKTLDPKDTVVFNVLKKRLPFKGSSGLYNEQNKNFFNISEFDKIVSYMEAINKNAPHVKNIVIDDMIYTMRKEYFKTAKITGSNL